MADIQNLKHRGAKIDLRKAPPRVMILFLGMLQGYNVSERLLDVPVHITPVGNKNAYLALGSNGLQLTSNPNEIARISKKGTKKYRIFMKGTPLCHKKDKRADNCKKGNNKTKNWNIKKGPNGYSIKSAKEELMGLKQYCLTYDQGPSKKVEIKKCRKDRMNQLFDIEPVESQQKMPKQDENKNDEVVKKKCDSSNSDAGSDEEGFARDSLSSLDVMEFCGQNGGSGKVTPQQPKQPPSAYSPYYPPPSQMPMYAYVSPQAEQPCVCPSDGTGA